MLAEADSHLGLTNRALANRARRVCLAFPLEGRDGDRYRVTGRPVPPKITDRAHARAQLGIGAGRDLRARLRRLARRALDQPRRVRGVQGRAVPRRPRRRHARLPGPEGARAALRAARLPRRRSGSRSPRPTPPSPAPAARSSSSPSTACRRVLIPYPHASADHQTLERALDGRRRRGARASATRELTPQRAARGDRRGARATARRCPAARASPSRTRRATSHTRSSPALQRKKFTPPE